MFVNGAGKAFETTLNITQSSKNTTATSIASHYYLRKGSTERFAHSIFKGVPNKVTNEFPDCLNETKLLPLITHLYW